MKLFNVWDNRDFGSVKQTGPPKRPTRENGKIPKGRAQLLEGSYPHPGRAGSCRSPPSRPCTRPSEQGSGIPTPPERTLWPHPWMSTVPEMRTHFTKRPSGESLSSHKMRRGERCEHQLDRSECSDRATKRILNNISLILLYYTFLSEDVKSTKLLRNLKLHAKKYIYIYIYTNEKNSTKGCLNTSSGHYTPNNN